MTEQTRVSLGTSDVRQTATEDEEDGPKLRCLAEKDTPLPGFNGTQLEKTAGVNSWMSVCRMSGFVMMQFGTEIAAIFGNPTLCAAFTL